MKVRLDLSPLTIDVPARSADLPAYTVTLYPPPARSICTCPGFRYKQRCRHIAEAQRIAAASDDTAKS